MHLVALRLRIQNTISELDPTALKFLNCNDKVRCVLQTHNKRFGTVRFLLAVFGIPI